MSSAVWVSSLAKMKITVTDAATKQDLWQATASMKIRDPTKFGNNLHDNVDKFIQKTMKDFPRKSDRAAWNNARTQRPPSAGRAYPTTPHGWIARTWLSACLRRFCQRRAHCHF
jgi:hypothetical protein